jgi:hypothetical protein
LRKMAQKTHGAHPFPPQSEPEPDARSTRACQNDF